MANFDVLDFGAKLEIHATILKERVNRLVQIFILIIAGDVKTA